jgi:hypothetical protein
VRTPAGCGERARGQIVEYALLANCEVTATR